MSGNEAYSAAEGGSRKRIKTSRMGRRDVSNDPASPMMRVTSETPVKIESGPSEGVALPMTGQQQQQQQQSGGHVHDGTCHHEQSLRSLHADMDAMRQLITCKMCYRFLYEPYGLSCGHTYCYSCLAQWMGNSKTCPDCRAKVKEQPTPTFVIREMVRVFVAKSELLPDGETREEHEKMAQEEADIVSKDKADEDIETGGLFRGRFRRGSRYHPVSAFRDESDNVWRCPSCTSEVEDGWCRGCNIRIHVDGESDNDSTMTDSDGDDIDGALQDMDHDNDVDLGLDIRDVFGSEGFEDGSSDIDDDDFDEQPVRNLDGGPPDRHMQHVLESEDDDSEGSMDGFIDEEVHFDDDATMDETENEAESTPARPSASQQRRRLVLSDSDDDAEQITGRRRFVVPTYQRFDDASSALTSRNTDNEDESEDEPISSNNQRHARRPRILTIDSDDEGHSSDAPPEDGQVDFSNYVAFSPAASAQTDDSNPVNLVSDDNETPQLARQPYQHGFGGYDGTRDFASGSSSAHDDDDDDDDDDASAGLRTSRSAPPYDIYDDGDDEELDSESSNEQSTTNGFYV